MSPLATLAVHIFDTLLGTEVRPESTQSRKCARPMPTGIDFGRGPMYPP